MINGTMLEKFNEFTSKKKSLKDKKNQLKKQYKNQLGNLTKQDLELQRQAIAKKMNVFVNGQSSYQ